MIVKITNVDDVAPAILELGPIFKEASGIPGAFKPDLAIAMWKELLKAGMGAIFAASHDGKVTGLLGAIISIDVTDGALLVSEAFWFMHPDHRGGTTAIKLLQAFEDWGKEIGANRILVAHLEASFADKLQKLYEHRGYEKVETVYRKEIYGDNDNDVVGN